MSATFDSVTTAIAEFAVEHAACDPPSHVVDTLRLHIVDGIGCALGAIDAEPCRAAREIALHTPEGASVIGSTARTTPELAAMANTTMVRYLDFNDSLSGRSGGHPTNTISGLIAMIECHALPGEMLLRGFHIATEIYGALCEQHSLRDGGWDAGAFLAPATAAALAAISGAGIERTAHAVSLATTSSVPLYITRAGELSAWKAGAEAHAVANAVLTTRLALAGMTGPSEPFHGRFAFEEQVVGPIDMSMLGKPVNGRAAIERTAIKLFPCHTTAQAVVELFLRLSERVDIDEIESIRVEAYDFLCAAIGGGRDDHAAKWDPQTRETADHSLPFVASVALTDGAVTLAAFEPDRIRDPQLRPLMQKFTVVESPSARGVYPPRRPVDVIMRLKSGEEIRDHCEFARGHMTSPATAADVNAKFHSLADGRVADVDELLERLWTVSTLDDLSSVMTTLRSATLAR